MAGSCGQTSVFLKTATFMTAIGVILLLLGFSTPLWRTRSNVKEGLWVRCENSVCTSVIGTMLEEQSWFIATQVLITLGLIFSFVGMILTLVTMCDVKCKQKNATRISALVSDFVTAGLLLTGIIVYWIEGLTFCGNYSLNFSWGITLASLIFFFVAGILLSVDMDRLNESDSEEGSPHDIESTENAPAVVVDLPE